MPNLATTKLSCCCVGQTGVALTFFFALALRSGAVVSNINAFTNRNAGRPSQRSPPQTRLPTRPTWRFSETPDFCQRLVPSPVANLNCPQRNQDTQRCPDGRISMMSQFKQDYYLFTHHFQHLNRRGIYLDVAANHPMHLSNSFFFDSCLGWDGLCVEGNPSYIEKLTVNRTCQLLPTCVSDKDGQNVTFVLGGGSGGIVETNKNMEYWRKVGTKHREMTLTCTTMRRALLTSNIRRVDYLSLDVEGHELKVLHGFDWENVIVNVMTVEVSKDTLPKIETYLKEKGYIRHYPVLDNQSKRSGLLHTDAVFLHKSVTFGQPV